MKVHTSKQERKNLPHGFQKEYKEEMLSTRSSMCHLPTCLSIEDFKISLPLCYDPHKTNTSNSYGHAIRTYERSKIITKIHLVLPSIGAEIYSQAWKTTLLNESQCCLYPISLHVLSGARAQSWALLFLMHIDDLTDLQLQGSSLTKLADHRWFITAQSHLLNRRLPQHLGRRYYSGPVVNWLQEDTQYQKRKSMVILRRVQPDLESSPNLITELSTWRSI